jgi:pyridoxal phosphate enzyme (YggS family)
MNISSEEIRINYTRVLEKAETAAGISGRNKSDVSIVVVTKLQPVEVVHNAILAGINIFGENYAEEAVPKIIGTNQLINTEWHMIGHVQSRKVKLISEYFQRIHSLDSLALAQKLEYQLSLVEKTLPTLLEFNIAGESSKTGWDASTEDDWSRLFTEIQPIFELNHLSIDGIMVMPPLSGEDNSSRQYFRKAFRLLEKLRSFFKNSNLHHLSMGTSADYEIAVQEGATFLRIGEAILGPRIKR